MTDIERVLAAAEAYVDTLRAYAKKSTASGVLNLEAEMLEVSVMQVRKENK